MTTFLLIRHGETDAVGKSMMGWTPGWRLNSRGKAHVQRLAERLARLPIRAVYTSPLERARETAEAIARKHELDPIPVDEFGEIHIGEWEGLDIAELDRREEWKRFNTFRSGVRCPGGELMLETQTRVVRHLLSLCGKHGEEIVAVVSHGDPLRSAVAYFLGMPLDLILRLEISPGSVSVLEIGDWGSRVLRLNSLGAEAV